eukprot:ctg_1010.g336
MLCRLAVRSTTPCLSVFARLIAHTTGTASSTRDGVRQSREKQGLLQAVSGEAAAAPRGQDRLSGAASAGSVGQDQVQLAQVPPGGADYQHGHCVPDRARAYRGRSRADGGVRARTAAVRHTGWADQLRRRVRHRVVGGASGAHQAGTGGCLRGQRGGRRRDVPGGAAGGQAAVPRAVRRGAGAHHHRPPGIRRHEGRGGRRPGRAPQRKALPQIQQGKRFRPRGAQGTHLRPARVRVHGQAAQRGPRKVPATVLAVHSGGHRARPSRGHVPRGAPPHSRIARGGAYRQEPRGEAAPPNAQIVAGGTQGATGGTRGRAGARGRRHPTRRGGGGDGRLLRREGRRECEGIRLQQ